MQPLVLLLVPSVSGWVGLLAQLPCLLLLWFRYVSYCYISLGQSQRSTSRACLDVRRRRHRRGAQLPDQPAVVVGVVCGGFCGGLGIVVGILTIKEYRCNGATSTSSTGCGCWQQGGQQKPLMNIMSV
jgi:hypothetical protein